MKIEYVSCEGKNLIEEDIIFAEFLEQKHWEDDTLIPMLICIRPDGTTFEVDVMDVCNISNMEAPYPCES